MLGCRWDAAEVRKWQEYKAHNRPLTLRPNVVPYTAEEATFLKKIFRSGFHFLHQHGLEVPDEEDREDGKAILRTIMREDDMSDDERFGDQEDDVDESDFEGHQADYKFTHRQLDWIEKHYRNSEQFMISYGLNFYDDEDLEEAKAIVEAMMEEDD